MKKRILSCLMALALCLTLLPTAALAEEPEGTAQTSPAVEEAADPANGKAKQENQPAAPEQEGQSTEQEEQQEDSATKQDEDVAAVQAMIDALPDAAELDGMDDEDAMAVYEAFQTACDAYYDTLTEEQQAQLKNTEKLAALSERFSQLETLAAGDTHTHCLCGDTSIGDHTAESQITFDKWLTSGYGPKQSLTLYYNEADKTSGKTVSQDKSNNWVLNGGNYYLRTDVENQDHFGVVKIDHTIVIKGEVTICLNGQTIQSKAEGMPVFEIASDGKLTLTDCGSAGKVTHASGVTGCGVYVNGGKFNLYGGSITGNTATKGGGVYVSSGEFNMYGGSITGNTAAKGGTGNGGGVYVVGDTSTKSKGTFTMSGGTISGNTTDLTDGGVGVYSGGKFIMNGGEITGNTASYESGGVGVYNSAEFTMNGGTIGGTNAGKANTATSGGGVKIGDYGKFTMTGGEISGNKATENGGGVYMYGGTFTVSGAAKVTGNKKNNANNNVYLPDNKHITIDGTLDDGAHIGVTTEKTPAADGSVIAIGNNLTDKDAEKFQSDLGGYAVSAKSDGTGLVLVKAHKHYLCGGDECVCNSNPGCGSVNFTAWTDSKKLPETKGEYYLDTDVTLTGTWSPKDGTVLCLNGHSITADGDVKAIYVIDITFTHCDCKGDRGAYGQITHPVGKTGSGVYVSGTGGFYMYGGNITGNTADNGGGVYMAGGQFTMNGGEISRNTTTTGDGGGGGVYVGGGTFTMKGSASITGNKTANDTYGGGVYVSGNGTFNMNDKASITDNTANQGGGVYVSGGKFNMSGGSITGNKGNGVCVVKDGTTFTVSGAATVKGNTRNNGASNVYLGGSDTTITIGGALTGGASIGVTKAYPRVGRVIATGSKDLTAEDAAKFKSDLDSYVVSVDTNDSKQLVLAEKSQTHTHEWSYQKDGDATIKAVCKGAGVCEANNSFVTIKAPTSTTYDGTEKPATLEESGNWKSAFSEKISIAYEQKNGDAYTTMNGGVPKDVGKYKASITVKDVTAFVEYEITDGSAPAKQDQQPLKLTVSKDTIAVGEKLPLTVSGGSGSGAVVYQALGDGKSAATIDGDVLTAVSAGKVTVKAVKKGDETFKEAVSNTITITITEKSGGTTPSQPGGGSSGGGGGSSSGSSDSNPVIKTETKNHADGSTTKTETRKDGSVTQTTTGKDGSVTKVESKPDGSSVTENKAADGSTGTVKTDKNGQTEAKTALSSKAIEDAKRNGEAVKAPVEVKATRNSSTAPTVKVELPQNSGETKVEIPVSNVTPGTVAVLVHPDGTEEIVKNSVPTENGIQLTVNGNATVKIVDNAKGFIDTQDHWAKDDIDFVSARGLVSGMSATIYAPNNSTTRAQLWTILARQNDADLTGGSVWYEKAQNWAKDKGVSDGTDPDTAINRAQMVTMLWRAAGQSAAAGSAANFTDVPADSYYAQAVAWAVENGITAGVGGGRFDPNGTCTRAQIATFLARSMK